MSDVDVTSAAVGDLLGVSSWLTIDQGRVDLFAEATGDTQFIHVDPVRAAAEGPFGGTVAHGFLLLSLVTAFGAEVLRLPAGAVAINFAVDGVRFLAPVTVGSRLRARFTLAGRAAIGPDRTAVRLQVALESEASEKPVLTISTLTIVVERRAG